MVVNRVYAIYRILKKLLGDVYHWYITSDSKIFINYLRQKGVVIGENVKFYCPASNVIDLTRPYLISIGNKVKITRGVNILTHGFDWCVLREIYKRPFGSAGRVVIGNNVYIGMYSTILKGVTIGNNVIIGTCSVVTTSIPDNSVAVGVPAKVISSIQEHYEKTISRELNEASDEFNAIERRLGREPRIEDFKEFFYLFLERDQSKFGKLPVDVQVGDYMEEFLLSQPKFKSFKDFAVFCTSIRKKD